MDTQQPTGDSAEILVNMESLIKGNNATITKNKIELKKMKEMLTDLFRNDPTYQQQDKTVKEATKIRQKTKSELLKTPGGMELSKKIKDLYIETKELQDSMSDYLREYQRMSGSSEIEDDEGNVMEIILVAKLIKPNTKFK